LCARLAIEPKKCNCRFNKILVNDVVPSCIRTYLLLTRLMCELLMRSILRQQSAWKPSSLRLSWACRVADSRPYNNLLSTMLRYMSYLLALLREVWDQHFFNKSNSCLAMPMRLEISLVSQPSDDNNAPKYFKACFCGMTPPAALTRSAVQYSCKSFNLRPN
jgi:hypothetical protein